MSWLDFVLFAVIGGVALWEMTRGFGRAVLDALALYGTLWAADAVSLPLCSVLPLSSHHAVNHCLAYALLLVTFGAGSLFLARFVYGMTLFHLGMFEGLFGLGAGIAAGMMCAHGLVHVVALSDGTGHGAQLVAGSFLANEMLSFSTYHSVIETLTGATQARQVPDVSR